MKNLILRQRHAESFVLFRQTSGDYDTGIASLTRTYDRDGNKEAGWSFRIYEDRSAPTQYDTPEQFVSLMNAAKPSAMPAIMLQRRQPRDDFAQNAKVVEEFYRLNPGNPRPE